MGFFELLLVGLSLAMDAFAVSISKGFTIKNIKNKAALKIAAYFAGFQMLMPLIGYLIGISLRNLIINIDHFIIFIILSSLGINMLKSQDEIVKTDEKLDAHTMVPLAIATSIDAMAMGITFSILKTNILFSIFIIGFVTFLLCFFGAKAGSKINFDNYITSKLSGIVLIIIGLKTLIEHLILKI